MGDSVLSLVHHKVIWNKYKTRKEKERLIHVEAHDMHYVQIEISKINRTAFILCSMLVKHVKELRKQFYQSIDLLDAWLVLESFSS